MAVGQQPGQRLADERGLADDDATDFTFDGLGTFGECLGSETGSPFGRTGRGHGPSGGQLDGSSELK